MSRRSANTCDCLPVKQRCKASISTPRTPRSCNSERDAIIPYGISARHASMPDVHISSFDDLLRVARQQAEPQRLLFVFVGAELPEDSTSEQRQRFAAGAGGALVPLMW